MAVRKLVRMGDVNLLKRSSDVVDIQATEVQQAIDDLIDSMHHYGGVGIAAPQIGYSMRIFIIEAADNDRYPGIESIPLTVCINPQIEILSDVREDDWEGCLSVPGYRGLVPRFTRLRYSAYDREGQHFEREVDGFHARAVQHENDHIDGVLFPMRIEDMSQFGCDDALWERLTGQSYPDHMKQRLRDHWDL